MPPSRAADSHEYQKSSSRCPVDVEETPSFEMALKNSDTVFTEKSPLLPLHSSRTSFTFNSDRSGVEDQCVDGGPDGTNQENGSMRRIWKWLDWFKVTFLCSIVLISMICFGLAEEHEPEFRSIVIDVGEPYYIPLADNHGYPILQVLLRGYFISVQRRFQKIRNLSDIDVFVTIQRLHEEHLIEENSTEVWSGTLTPPENWPEVQESTESHYFDLQGNSDDWKNYSYRIKFFTDGDEPVPLSISTSELPRAIEHRVTFAACILVGLYILIVFDLIHRSLAAMICGVVALGVLSVMNLRPTLARVISWFDVETLCLLFGMMVLVAILSETGFFDYITVLAYRLAKGRLWTILSLLCLFTAVVSAFLDNVTTILLMTPVTIRLCEVMQLNPKSILITLVIFSNVGGTATAVGDPPNVIIVSNEALRERNVGFTNLTIHMSLGSLISLVVCYGVVRFMFRNIYDLHFSEPLDVIELRKEIQVWKRTAGSMSCCSIEERAVNNLLQTNIRELEDKLSRMLWDKRPSEDDYEACLRELTNKYRITNLTLLIKTSVVMGVVILLFLHSLPWMTISLGWIAIFGAIFLLVLAGKNEVEHIFAHIEWTTLVFFAGVFVIMEALNELGLLNCIGTLVENTMQDIPESCRLAVAIIVILWVSAISSSFIDNIPFTTAMVKIIARIGTNPELDIPLYPLIWALAFGVCFGGNGTLIGASANVVCAGVAEHHGYRISFIEFFKIGFPIMLVTTCVAMAYLLVSHVLFDWNYS